MMVLILVLVLLDSLKLFGLKNLMLLFVVGLWLVEIMIFIFVCIEWVKNFIVGVGIGFSSSMFMLVLVSLVVRVFFSI